MSLLSESISLKSWTEEDQEKHLLPGLSPVFSGFLNISLLKTMDGSIDIHRNVLTHIPSSNPTVLVHSSQLCESEQINDKVFIIYLPNFLFANFSHVWFPAALHSVALLVQSEKSFSFTGSVPPSARSDQDLLKLLLQATV